MRFKVYTKRKYDGNEKAVSGIGKSVMLDTAESFYAQLEEACGSHLTTAQRYDYLRSVFSHAVEQAVRNCQIAFVGLFSKLDYCEREYNIPHAVSNLLHLTRKDLFPEATKKHDMTEAERQEAFPHNLKATALLVYHLCGKEEIPATLKLAFPKADRKAGWGKFDEKVLRGIVERWDEKYIWVREEENNTTIQVCYGEENKYLTREGSGSWDYLQQILWEGAQLNLVQIRMSERGDVYMPELVILEPDYLINITTIAGCFETYAESPFVNLVKKIAPQQNSQAIHLGNFAGQLLDDTVHGREISFEDSLKAFVNKNALNMITCEELKSNFHTFVEDGKKQKENIRRLICDELPRVIGRYDTKDVRLEPSFFSEVLGIQGRFDFLHEGDEGVTIIEQKSGKGDFVSYRDPAYNPNIPREKEQHAVQAILYRALYQYEFQRYAKDIRMMLLYSKYSQGLLPIDPMPKLFLRAMKMRNLLAWSEYLYAKEGLDILATLTPEKLNQKGSAGKLWEQYTKPQLEELLSPIHKASDLERMYYLRFLRFLENEQLLSKVGNKLKENSGFASIWHDTLETKKSAGNIYDQLEIVDFSAEDEEDTSVLFVTLRFLDRSSAETANFRTGDIVLLYPYRKDEVPNACYGMVTRANIVDIKENTVVVRLRNSQTDKRIFAAEDCLWAIEHDMFESMTGGLYSAMHSFLSATKDRRDLLLSQRMPQTDTARQLKGDYGTFNILAERVKQAKDLFLIIGPPGTGKTSYGLTNVLREELLEEGTSVLLLSYTNRAVDEICSKLVEIKREQPDFDFIRIGSDLSCAAEYRDFLLTTRSASMGSANDIAKMIRGCRVFCGTTSAVNANIALLQLKHFSLAIVDESSQILEPHLIGLLSARQESGSAIDKFVLIGDHKQLPAVVQQPVEESVVTEPELNAINLTDCRLSLFERLLRQFKTEAGYDERFVYMLTKQGRMHSVIAEFPNITFYGGRLDIVPLKHQTADDSELCDAMQKRIAFHAVTHPSLSPSDKTNESEAEAIAAAVYNIYKGVGRDFDVNGTVGVIVPYRNQITTIRNAIDKYGVPELHDITIDTVERFQGSQRDYILYGFTIQQTYQLNFLTNNTFEEDGTLIDRKLNVAMTRARLALMMFGNPAVLRKAPVFAKLLDYMKEKGAYVSCPN